MTRLYSSRIKAVSIYKAERIQSIVNSVALVCSRVHGRSTHEACQVRVVVVVQHGLNRFKFTGILLRCISSLAEECISCILEGYIDLDCMYGVTEDRLRSCSADHAYLSSCLAFPHTSTCHMRINLPYAYIFSNASINLINLHYMIQNASINSTCLKSQKSHLYADLILWDPSPESDTTGSAQCHHTYNHAQLPILSWESLQVLDLYIAELTRSHRLCCL